MHKVAILAYKHTALFELGCAVELFALPRPEFKNWYQTEVVTLTSDPVEATGGLKLSAKRVRSLSSFDTVIIPNWPSTLTDIDPAISKAVLAAHEDGKRLLSLCSGAFLLAELGLLDGFEATTHWRYSQLFQSRYPKVNYIDDVLYVYANNIGCSAGSAAGLDLGIEIIRQDFGYKTANKVARRLVLSAHRAGGQSQFAETPVLSLPTQFSKSLHWATSHLTEDISIDALAEKASMSRRTFDRKFRNSLNTTPKEWLTLQRLNRAKGFLESEAWNVDQVALQSGFENAITMRHHFRKQLGLSPNQYRQQFMAGT